MKNYIFLNFFLFLSFNLFSQDLIISGVFDGPLSGGKPKGVELYATADIADLSAYGLGSANNGGGTDGQEFTFPSDSASAGDYIYVTANSSEFLTYYGFSADYVSNSVEINGDDAIELFYNSSVIDTYGEPNVDGNGDPWEYLDGWAYRVNNTGPDASWVQNNWTYSGANAVDGCTTNNGCSSVMPVKTFNKLSISSATTTISTDASYDVVVVTGGTLNINKDASLTVKMSFSNSGGTVNLNSDADEFASLIVQGTSSGNITYKRWIADEGSNEWDLIGSPVAGQSISSFVSANPKLADEGNQYAIGVFSNDGSTDSAAAMYTNYTSDGAGSTTSVNDAGNFNLGQGYAMATDETDTPGTNLNFTGTVRTTDLTGVAIDDNTANAANFGKWNLVANPYPSYLNANDDADATASNNFLGVNASNLHSSFAYVYGYDGDGTYTYYNHITPGSAVYIAPGQGFFVASDDPGGNTIQFTEAMQTVNGSDDFNAENSDVMNDTHEVSLRLYHDNQMIDEAKLFFEENLGLGLDVGYDAGSFSQEASIMTRLVEEDEGHGMAINAMGLDAMENAVIPLVINQAAGQEFRINLHTATIPDPNVYLEDVEEGTFTNLYEGDFVYTPTSDLEGVGRFFIHMTADTMSNEEVSTSMLNAYKEIDASYITIEGLATQSNETKVSLYNILGREVLATTLNNNMGTQTISTVGLSAGIYVIELESGSDRLTKKLLIQ